MAELRLVRTFTKGDTYAVLRVNTGLDLTGFTTPVLEAREMDAGTNVADTSGSVVSPATAGLIDFDCAATLAAAKGNYRASYRVTDASSKIQHNFEDFLIVTKLKPTELT